MITPITAGDRGFVFDSWIKSYGEVYYERDADRRIVGSCTPMPWPHYLQAQSLLIDRLLERSLCLVYRSPVDDSVIRGYAVGEAHQGALVMHWAFTRSNRRRSGVMRELLDELRKQLGCGPDSVYTHQKNPGARWLDAMGFVFEPKAISGEKR